MGIVEGEEYWRKYLGGGIAEEALEVGEAKVGDTNVLDLAGVDELLQLAPGVDVVPVGVVLLEVVRVGAGGPVHEVEVDVVGLEVFEGLCNGLGDALVPGVVELGGEPNLLTGDARGNDAVANLFLILVGKSGINVAVAVLEGGLDSELDLVGGGLPGSQADGGDLGTRVEGEGAGGLGHFGQCLRCTL